MDSTPDDDDAHYLFVLAEVLAAGRKDPNVFATIKANLQNPEIKEAINSLLCSFSTSASASPQAPPSLVAWDYQVPNPNVPEKIPVDELLWFLAAIPYDAMKSALLSF